MKIFSIIAAFAVLAGSNATTITLTNNCSETLSIEALVRTGKNPLQNGKELAQGQSAPVEIGDKNAKSKEWNGGFHVKGDKGAAGPWFRLNTFDRGLDIYQVEGPMRDVTSVKIPVKIHPSNIHCADITCNSNKERNECGFGDIWAKIRVCSDSNYTVTFCPQN
jgi:hypothetical protein